MAEDIFKRMREINKRIDEIYIVNQPGDENDDFKTYGCEKEKNDDDFYNNPAMVAASKYTEDGQIPTAQSVRLKKAEDKQTEDQIFRDEESTDPYVGTEPLLSHVFEVRKQLFERSNFEIENNFEQYTLSEVIRLCNNIKGKKFTILNNKAEDCLRVRKQIGNKAYYGDFKNFSDKWYGYCEHMLKNKNGRFGYVFEMLLGNYPGTNSEADLKGEGDNSVEAKSKKGSDSFITVSREKIENLKDSLKHASLDIHEKCEEMILFITNLMNKVIREDIEKNKDLQILGSEQKNNTRNVKIKYDQTITTLLSFDVKCFDTVNNEHVTLHYLISYYSYIERNIREGTASIILKFLIDKGDMVKLGNENDLTLRIPMDLVLEKLSQKCPNIAIAFGNDEDIPPKNGSIIDNGGVCFQYNNFDFYKMNQELKNEKKISCLTSLLNKGIFKITLKIGSNFENIEGNSQSTKKQNSLSMRLIPQFDYEKIRTEFNSESELYKKVTN